MHLTITQNPKWHCFPIQQRIRIFFSKAKKSAGGWSRVQALTLMFNFFHQLLHDTFAWWRCDFLFAYSFVAVVHIDSRRWQGDTLYLYGSISSYHRMVQRTQESRQAKQEVTPQEQTLLAFGWKRMKTFVLAVCVCRGSVSENGWFQANADCCALLLGIALWRRPQNLPSDPGDVSESPSILPVRGARLWFHAPSACAGPLSMRKTAIAQWGCYTVGIQK